MNTEVIWTFLSTQGIDFGLKVLGAIAAWIVGRWLIGIALNVMGRMLVRGNKIDQTLANYIKSIIGGLLTLVLVLAILDMFGVKTTSFAALLAGAGLAVGAAWSGMLGNFAAGLFMQVLRPYKVGDFITAGGVTGTVTELGLFATTTKNVLTFRGEVDGNTMSGNYGLHGRHAPFKAARTNLTPTH